MQDVLTIKVIGNNVVSRNMLCIGICFFKLFSLALDMKCIKSFQMLRLMDQSFHVKQERHLAALSLIVPGAFQL